MKQLSELDSHKLQAHVKERLEVKGWRFEVINDLPPIHCRDSLVTPYFNCWHVRRDRKNRDLYRIEGAIGVIHRGFERKWATKRSSEDAAPVKSDVFATIVLIDNIRALDVDKYLVRDSYQGDLERFADSLSSVLDTIPDNVTRLRADFERGEMGGRPIGWFRPALEDGAKKFDALVEFVQQLPRAVT